jgi:hypothetical protein
MAHQRTRGVSYFFPITAEIVERKSASEQAGYSGYTATHSVRTPARRLRHGAGCSHVAGVADLQALRFSLTSKSERAERNCEWWRALFEERAAIREREWGNSRAEAEVDAFGDLVARWLALNQLPASTDAECAQCGAAAPDTPMLARNGHAWIHRTCWRRMSAARAAQAATEVRELLGRAS